jgi:hypothetical protein
MPEAPTLRSEGKVIDALIEYFAQHDILAVPPRGRQIDIAH